MTINSNNLSILQWNCRSITKNLESLIQHLSTNHYHLLSLQSLNCSSDNLPKMPNFFFPPIINSTLTSNRIQTAIYIHKDINFTSYNFPIPPNSTGIFHCSVKFIFQFTQYILISVYLPNGPNNNNTQWLANLPDISPFKYIVTGDFNSHAPFWETNCSHITHQNFLEHITSSPLYILNNGNPTRLPDNIHHKPTAIDLTLVSPSISPLAHWNTWKDPLNSDHLPITLTIGKSTNTNTPKRPAPSSPTPTFKLKSANWDTFNSSIYTTLNPSIFSKISIENVDTCYSSFTNSLIQAAHLAIPTHKNTLSTTRQGNAWWSSDCETARKEKYTAYYTYLRHRSPQNLLLAKQKRNQCNRVILQAKRLHWEQFCSEQITNHTSIHTLWKKIKSLQNNIDLPTYPITLPHTDLPSNTEKSECFAKIFAHNSQSSGLSSEQKQLRQSPSVTPPPPIHITPNNDQLSYLNLPFTFDELTSTIQDLPSKKTSPGPDGIPYIFIQHLPTFALHLLLQFFNFIWSSHTFPSLWRKSIIVPLHKSGKPTSDPQSYRPIALTCHLCKLMEKLIHNRLSFYCQFHHIIPITQSGFQRHRSTTEQLIKLTSLIKLQFSKRQNVLATFFDVSKAFDRVWHRHLLLKLSLLNFSGNILQFLSNFLSQRLITVKIHNTLSTYHSIDMGLPQGSILSPILFIIYLYDLPYIFPTTTNLCQFADDISISHNIAISSSTSRSKLSFITKSYQKDLTALNTYLFHNGLSLAIEKTKLIFFSPGYTKFPLPKLSLQDTPLVYSQTVKFLGILLTNKLNWLPHFQTILSKARKGLNLIKCVSSLHWGKNSTTLRSLALTLVRSRLTYAHECFFSAPHYLLQKLESLDCKAFKLALSLPYHTNNLSSYGELNILPLSLFRLSTCCKFLIKSKAISTHCSSELSILSSTHYPKRGSLISSLTPIGSFTLPTISSLPVPITNIENNDYTPPLPFWILLKATFLNLSTYLSKTSPPHVLRALFLEFIQLSFPSHLKIYTDGSKLDDNNVGAGFVIPNLNITSSLFLGPHYSIFTAELVAIYSSLLHISNHPPSNLSILICSDSQSAIISIQKNFNKHRSKLISDIQILIHHLISRTFNITFIWTPAHCNIPGNEKADRAAKLGAINDPSSTPFQIPYSTHELYHSLHTHLRNTLHSSLLSMNNSYSQIRSLTPSKYSPPKYWKFQNTPYRFYLHSICARLRTNSLKTKYIRHITCPCGQNLSLSHILLTCPASDSPNLSSNFTADQLHHILDNIPLLISIATSLSSSPLSNLI